MKGRRKILVAAILVAFCGLFRPTETEALQTIKPVIVVYIAENMSLTRERPSFADSVVNGEFARRGFKVVSTAKMTALPELIPRDVASVWNADKRAALRSLTRADVLWLATVQYEPDSRGAGQYVSGKVTFTARAFNLANAESLWFQQVKDSPFKGATLQGAARQALAEVLPKMAENFALDPKVKSWLPPPPSVAATMPGLPLMNRTPLGMPPGETPSAIRPATPALAEGSRRPYTGVIIEAEHLSVLPSYRSGVYSEGGQAIIPPESSRMSWAESSAAARAQAGSNPLRIRASSSNRNGIVLRDSDARRLQQERGLMERARTAIIVHPPKRSR